MPLAMPLACRLNHYRPEFFTHCPGQKPVCYAYNKQRSVRPLPSAVPGGLLWAAAPLRAALAGSYHQQGSTSFF